MSLDDKEARKKSASRSLKSYHKNKNKLREKNLELINSDLQKKCPKCEILFPIAEFITPSGFKHPYCKKCTSIYKRTKYKESDIEKEKVKKRDEKYRKNNYEKIKKYQDAYREEHRTELNEKAAIYRDNNREKIRESQKQYYQNNPEKIKASLKNSYLKRQQRMKEDPEYAQYQYEKQRRNSRRSYTNNRESILKKLSHLYRTDERYKEIRRRSVRKWNKAHPEKARAIQRRRKLLKKGAILENFNDIEYTEFLNKWQYGRCFHCNTPIDIAHHVDHLYPIVKNGRHAKQNLALSCPFCNGSKGKKLLGIEWTPLITRMDVPIFIPEEYPNIHVIPTFFCSDRNLENPRSWVVDYKKAHPESLLFFDFEWEEKQTLIIESVKNKLGLSKTLGARKTQCVEIEIQDAQEFLETFHVQGFGSGTFYLGLVYEDSLVGVSSWICRSSCMELNRMAFKGTVVGGFSKMLKSALSHPLYTGNPIISFVDSRYATGESYKEVGFKENGETSSPTYWYVNGSGLFHRRLFQKSLLKDRMDFFREDLTEKQIAHANGFHQVWGTKQKRFIYFP